MFSKLSVAALALVVAAVAMSAPARALEFDNRRGDDTDAGDRGTVNFDFGNRRGDNPAVTDRGNFDNFDLSNHQYNNFGGYKHYEGKSKVVELTDCTYYNFVRAPVAFKPIAVLFCTDECPVCKKLEKLWDKLSKWIPHVVFAKVNTIEEQEVQKREDIDVVPGVILFTKYHPDGLRFVAPSCEEEAVTQFVQRYCNVV
jgi:thiol-disulfide isomerase/thioredoxin